MIEFRRDIDLVFSNKSHDGAGTDSGRFLHIITVGNFSDAGIAVSQDVSTDICFLD